MINVCFSLVFFMLAVFFESFGLKYLYVQFLLLAIRRGFIIAFPIIVAELFTEGYPLQKCKSIGKNILVSKEFRNKKYPIELIYAFWFYWGGLVVFSLLLWITGKYIVEFLEIFFAGYILFCVVLDLILIRKAYRIAFYEGFKRISRHNWIYYLFGCSRFKRPPQRAKLGTCMIIKEGKRHRRVYYTVRVKKSGNMYDKVMYCGEGMCKIDREHTLYEICGVRYIM